MKIEPDGSGMFRVVSDEGEVLRDGLSNEAAWREADKLSGEFLSRKESAHAWSFRKNAVGSVKIPTKKQGKPKRRSKSKRSKAKHV